ncbi:hypothetical protein DMENIID0001_079410 [Sergentomyia squamirostris]
MENDNANRDLVETIVREVKSQGLFDQFRKDCLSDVDTKPAYQNLRQRVESSVASFLGAQEWKPDANRIQMREKLRKNIIGLSFLETGVDRIVDQVVNPKISTVFLPHIEDIVYKYLGIEKPLVKPKDEPVFMEQNGEIQVDLLPTDLLEAVSPDSDKKSHCSEDVKEEITEEEIVPELNESNDKMDDDESPPFEPLEGRPVSPADHKESQDSHASEISGLTSQDSVFSAKIPSDGVEEKQEVMEEEVMQPPRIDQMVEKGELPERSVSDAVEAMDVGNQDSQLSQVSSNSRLSIVTNESDSKDGESLKMDLSEEAQMPEFNENHSSSEQKFTSFDINKDEIKIQQAPTGFPQPPEPTEAPPPLPPTPPPPPAEEKPEPPAEPADDSKNAEAEIKPEEVSSSSSAEKLERVSERKKSKKSHKERKSTKSSDGNSSAAADSDASPVLQIVETDTVDSGDLTQAEKSKRSSSHKSSSRRDEKKRDSHRRHHKSSSRDKKSSKKDDHSSQREKHQEKRRSADRDSNDGSTGPKPPSSTPSSGSEATASQSTAPASAGESSSTSSANAPVSTAAVAPSSSADSATEKVTLATRPIIVDQILTANSEINLQLIVNHSSNDPTLAKIEELAKKSLARKKPKIASNFQEAKRMMKMRKKIDLESKKNMEKAMVLAKNYINAKAEKDPSVSEHLTQGIELEFACSQSGAGPIISSPVKGLLHMRQSPAKEEEEVTTSVKPEETVDSEAEEDLLHFPDPLSKYTESITEKWWNDQKSEEKKPKSKKLPKNGLLQKNIVIRNKRSHDLNDSTDGPEEKCAKFGDLNGNEDIVTVEEKKIPRMKTPSSQQQRYSSDDLYKPRPFIHGQRTRRRAFESAAGTDDGGTA